MTTAGHNRKTPLMIAAELGHLHVAECLLNNGADVTLKTMNGKTALHIAAATCPEDDADIVEQLIIECSGWASASSTL